MKTAKPMPSIDRLRELLEVSEDSASGLRWLTTSKKVRAGATAGSVRSDGYWRVFIDGQRYMTHRIVYAMSVGEIPYGMQVDHADMNPGNNRPENLRLVSASENQWNTGGSRVKASGLPKTSQGTQQATRCRSSGLGSRTTSGQEILPSVFPGLRKTGRTAWAILQTLQANHLRARR